MYYGHYVDPTLWRAYALSAHAPSNPLSLTRRVMGPLGLELYFDPNEAFDPQTGRVVHGVFSTDALSRSLIYQPGLADRDGWFSGHFWGPFGTVLGGAAIAATISNPIGWGIGVVTIVGGFSWAVDDIKSWRDELGKPEPPRGPSGPPEVIEISEEEAAQDEAAAAAEGSSGGGGGGGGDGGGGGGGGATESDVQITDEEAAADAAAAAEEAAAAAAGKDVSPDSDRGLGGSTLPPGVIRIIGSGPVSQDPEGGSGGGTHDHRPPRPTWTPNPEGEGPQGPLARSRWIVAPLHLPALGVAGREVARDQVLGFVGFRRLPRSLQKVGDASRIGGATRSSRR